MAAGCVPLAIPMMLMWASADSSYYRCPGYVTGEKCYICNAGFTYDAGTDECSKDPCTAHPSGDGCTASVGTGETIVTNPPGYCVGSTRECVGCWGGYSWDGLMCDSCGPTCPSGVQGGSYSGCVGQGTVGNANRVSSIPGFCDLTKVCFQDGAIDVCYECNNGWHWDTGQNDCEPDCTPNAGSCTSDGQCCGGSYCSKNDEGGTPLGSGNYHCCTEGFYWDNNLGQCFRYDPCVPTPCPIRSGNPFNPGDPWWTNTPECNNQDTACCYTEIYGSCSGDDCYFDLWNEAY